jgi:hypothetical protein
MTPYDPKNRRPYPSAPLYEYAVQRGDPEGAVPLGELPGAALEPALLPMATLFPRLMARGSAGGALPGNSPGKPMPRSGISLSDMLRRDDAPTPLPMPRYRTKPSLGYGIPLIPRQERSASSMWEMVGTPSSPDFDTAVLYDRMLKAAVAEREAASGRVAEAQGLAPGTLDAKRVLPTKNAMRMAPVKAEQLVPRESNSDAKGTGEPPARSVRNTLQASWFGEDEKEKQIRQEFEALQKSTDANMIVRMEANRIWAIQNNRQVIFNIEDNPTLTGEAPIYRFHKEGYYAVKDHDDTIVRESQRFGVNPDFVRAIMCVENADGHRFGGDQLVQRLGIEDTVLPMNIDSAKWDGIGGISKEEFADPKKNIRAGVALIKGILDRVDDPTPAKVGSIWQFSGAEKVSANGAKIERVMRERLWEKLPEEGMPDPHVP